MQGIGAGPDWPGQSWIVRRVRNGFARRRNIDSCPFLPIHPKLLAISRWDQRNLPIVTVRISPPGGEPGRCVLQGGGIQSTPGRLPLRQAFAGGIFDGQQFGKTNQARALLLPRVAWFSEGLDRPYILQAESLLSAAEEKVAAEQN